jgi:hypothetical protein
MPFPGDPAAPFYAVLLSPLLWSWVDNEDAFVSSANIALLDKHIIGCSSDKDAPKHD